MSTKRLPINDPRTLARDIPGLFDALFPRLVPGVVAFLNRNSFQIEGIEPVSEDLVGKSGLQHAMLFEVAIAAAEQLLDGQALVDWSYCLEIAGARQRRHFDAKVPTDLSPVDREIALHVATNLRSMLTKMHSMSDSSPLVRSPIIPGFQWIASSVGDFAVQSTLIEVKCTNKHFSSSDYRQIVTYWLLSYLAAVERGSPEWTDGVLLNPRRNLVVKLSFDSLVGIIGAERTKLELLEIFSAMVERDSLN